MLILYGFVIHLIFLVSIFDIYFKSPVIHGVKEYIPEGTFPASRLVLFSADGLRAQSLFKSNNAKYLKSLMKNRGLWGISHTRVPTESRPGHVAMIAGLYEDPSAVAKGWKDNPVEFDSVFNRSRHTWSWGSPDIIPMFAKGATGNHVETHFYGVEVEDFSGKVSTTKTDIWVFEKVEEFLKKSKNNSGLKQLLHSDKIIFFLHLLGLDTAGHTYTPNSKYYEENIKVVDEGIAKMEQLFEEFYGHDNRTVYVFTADHGMTDWGSHGAGDDHETQTPLITWGAGVPVPDEEFDIQNENYFESKNRKDVNQADICPLMAALIGIPIPVNSVGVLPESYFDLDLELKAKGFHSNARQMLAQYDKKRELIEDYAIQEIYKPFPKLTHHHVVEKIKHIDGLLHANQFEEVVKFSKEAIYLSLLGLEYYQNYYQSFLLNCMTVSFLGWIWWLLTVLVQEFKSHQQLDKSPLHHKSDSRAISNIDILIHAFFATVSIITIALINIQNLPLQYNVYCGLPIILWWKGLLSWRLWFDFLTTNNGSSLLTLYCKYIFQIVLYFTGVTILVFSFFDRWLLSICLFGISIIQLQSKYRRKLPQVLIASWILTSLGLAGFSFLPVVGKDHNIHLVGGSGLLWFFSSLIFLMLFSLKMLKSGQETKKENIVMLLPIIMMLMAIQNKYFVDYMFSAKKGLPLLNQIVSWGLAAVSCFVPMFSSTWVMSRLFSIKSSFAVFFILLSVSHEGFFLFTLACNLMCWLLMEHYTCNDNREIQITHWNFKQNKLNKYRKISTVERALNSDDFRRSFTFLFYIIISFFGIGNLASINSFDPQWVRCFVSQFLPFLMAALILCKTLIPFLFVACTFRAVNLVAKARVSNVILIVLIFSDIMGIYFLHFVTNKGSWLDIGSSISHYVIMETIVLFVSLLYGFGEVLTGTSNFSFKSIMKKIKIN